MQPEQILAEAPVLPQSLQQRAAAGLERLMRAARFSLFWDTLGPDAVFSTGDDGGILLAMHMHRLACSVLLLLAIPGEAQCIVLGKTFLILLVVRKAWKCNPTLQVCDRG